MRRCLIVPVLGLLAACAQGSEMPTPPKDFNPGPPPEGYTRFYTPPVELAPGEEVLLTQWLALPADADMDVVDTRGGQSQSGHHVVLYASKEARLPGTTRPAVEEDQIGTRTLGVIGSEGQAAYKLPEGVVYRLFQGDALVANVHYLNASSHKAVGQTYLDVKLSPPSPGRKVASRFANSNTLFKIPPHGAAEAEASCAVVHDVELLNFANHMHHLGASVRTVVQQKGGGEVELRNDEGWNKEFESNPPLTTWPPGKPFVLYQGDVVKTRCTWKNPGPHEVGYFTEMCMGFGLFYGEKDITCNDGQWLE